MIAAMILGMAGGYLLWSIGQLAADCRPSPRCSQCGAKMGADHLVSEMRQLVEAELVARPDIIIGELTRCPSTRPSLFEMIADAREVGSSHAVQPVGHQDETHR